MTKKKLSFEESLARLENITQQIEEGKVGLEDSIDRYEEGMGLVKQCRDMLSKAEMRIQKLHEKADGSLGKSKFEDPSPT